jgi:hypothetical protein
MGILWTAPSQAEERTELHIFQYDRADSGELKSAFSQFRGLLTGNMPKLSDELQQVVTMPALSRLRLKSVIGENGDLERPEARVSSLQAKRKYWRDTGALSVLTGHLRQEDDIPYVYTTFFWGELKGKYPSEMITLKLSVAGESFDNTYDSHSVAIIYALAQETRDDCDNAVEIISLLSEAHKRAKAISSDLPELAAELEELVVAAIDEIRNDCSE